MDLVVESYLEYFLMHAGELREVKPSCRRHQRFVRTAADQVHSLSTRPVAVSNHLKNQDHHRIGPAFVIGAIASTLCYDL